MKSTVAIVVTLFDSEQYLRHTLESIYSQSRVPDQIIFVDDGSTKSMYDELVFWSSGRKFDYRHQNNRGMAAARNLGLQHVSCDYVCFLDHDDILPTDKIEWQSDYLDEHPEVVLIGGRSCWIGEDLSVSGIYQAKCGEITFLDLLKKNHLSGPGGALIRTGAMKALNGFDITLFGVDDWDLYFRLMQYGRVVHADRLSLCCFQHERQASRNSLLMLESARRMVTKERRALGLARHLIYRTLAPIGHIVANRKLYRKLLQNYAQNRNYSVFLKIITAIATVHSSKGSLGFLLLADLKQAARGDSIFSWFLLQVKTRLRKTFFHQHHRLPRFPPSCLAKPGDYSIHTLVQGRDVNMLILSAKSLSLSSNRGFRRFFHDDGSLSVKQIELLKSEFPDCAVITRKEADALANSRLREYPNIAKWRSRNIYALKLIDFALWADSSVLANIDSDILFFKSADLFINLLSKRDFTPCFNRDVGNFYALDCNTIQQLFGIEMLESANAGFWVMPSRYLSLDKIETWLEHPRLVAFHDLGVLEQTFVVMLACSGKSGAKHFPQGYDMTTDSLSDSTVCRHYAGVLRPHFFGQGTSRIRENFGESLIGE